MCRYITDDGETCGIDSHEGDYCHLHADSNQAAAFRAGRSSAEAADSRAEPPQSIVMDTTCTKCGAALRRRERLTEHESMTRAHYFEAVVECDCSEYVIATSSTVRERRAPDGWF